MQPELYAEMKSFAAKYGNGRYDFNVMSAFRQHRYNVSRATNDKFFWAPQSILEYGAASFTYASFCNATEDATCSSAGESSVASFYGAEVDESAPSGYKYVPERIPPNWYRRATPYDLGSIGPQMIGEWKDEIDENMVSLTVLTKLPSLSFPPLFNFDARYGSG